jgi:ABC-type nitrate/sulfonate/bicarbonate transport system substrate-binding protein
MRSTPLFAVLVLLLAALTGCGAATSTPASPAASGSAASAASAAPETATVTLIMDWVPWVLDIPVDVAQEKGYYADRGLTVKQIVPAGPTDVVKFVSTGKAKFGLYYAPDTLAGVEAGAPLVSVAGLMSHAPVGIAMAPGQHAATPKDLASKVVGVVLIPSTRASFQTMLKAGGVSPDAVKVADPGYEIVAPLLAGKYAGVAVTQFGELVQAQQTGQTLDYLDFRDWGTPDYAFLNLISEQGFADKDPATVRAFVAATLAGLEYAAQHPDEAVALYVKRHPELKADLLLAQWKAALPSLATAGSHPAGWQDAQAWQKLDEWMVRTGQLKKAVDVSGVVSNAYLPGQ